jgi:hypothetical protein
MTTTPDPNALPDPNQSPTPAGPPPGPVGYNPPPGPSGWTPAGPMGYAPPPPMPKKRPWLAILILVGIVVFIGVVLYVVRNQTNVNSLAIGDCFNEPSSSTSVTDVERQPCTGPHDDEVFFLVTDSTAGAYPGVDHFRELAGAQCLPAASAYLATDFNARPDIDAGYFYPTQDSWDGGDRGLTCYLYRVDTGQFNASVKNIGTAPLP